MSENDSARKQEANADQKAEQAPKEEMKKEAPKEGSKTPPKEAALEAALAAEKEESAKWKNSYYLAYADLDNLRKELEKDHREAVKYRAEGFLDNLLPALDSFYIALQSSPASPEAKNYQIGFTYIYNQITSVLSAEGVSEILPKANDKFDSAVMHAVDVEEADTEGLVARVLAKGFKLKDRLVRPAMVVVTKKKADEKKASSDVKPLDDKKEEAAKA